MNTLTRLSLACVSLCLPIAAVAAAPGSVTGIEATLQGGKVFVSWTPLADTSVTAYRIFYSHASILSSNGSYDDYETVDSSVNSYTLANTPISAMVYVSVLAVNADGEESAYFAEEASVTLSATQPTSSMPSVTSATTVVSSSAPTAVPAGSTQQLLSVRTLSATGVELTFTQPVSIDPSKALEAFTIETGSGDILTITRLTVDGTIVRLDTLPQTRGIAYVLIVGDGVAGSDPFTGAATALDPMQSPMLFMGDASGTMTPSASSSPSVSSAMPIPSGADVSAFALRAQSEGNNLYTMQATWQLPADATLAGIRVLQTTDGGETFGSPRTLEKNTSGITVPHVPAGSFGLRVQAVYVDGSLSAGVEKIVDLPSTGSKPTNPVTGSVIPSKPVTSLPNSGPGLLTMLLMTGAATGYAVMKRRNQTMA